MKFAGRFDGREAAVELAADGSLRIDGAECAVDLVELRPGAYSALAAGRSLDIYVTEEGPEEFRVAAGAAAHRIELRDPRRWSPGWGAAAGAGTLAIASKMPGKVVRVLAAAGAEVEQGQPLLVVEAMKMQNEIRAPRAGRLAALDVAEGASVAAGQRLALLE